MNYPLSNHRTTQVVAEDLDCCTIRRHIEADFDISKQIK